MANLMDICQKLLIFILVNGFNFKGKLILNLYILTFLREVKFIHKNNSLSLIMVSKTLIIFAAFDYFLSK